MKKLIIPLSILLLISLTACTQLYKEYSTSCVEYSNVYDPLDQDELFDLGFEIGNCPNTSSYSFTSSGSDYLGDWTRYYN